MPAPNSKEKIARWLPSRNQFIKYQTFSLIVPHSFLNTGVHWAEDYAAEHPEISIDILDLRTLLPLDYLAIREAVKRTGRVLILHEDTLVGGIGGEIAAWIGENCFALLDAPVMRCASLDTPVPFAIDLEKNFLASARLDDMVKKLVQY